MKHLFIAFCLSLAIPYFVAAESPAKEGAQVGKWTMDYDAGKALAIKEQIPMILNFTGSDWCHWCILMDKQVFAKDIWKRYASQRLVLVTLDFPQDQFKVPAAFVTRNKQLKNKYGVEGYPSYLVIDIDGETVLGRLGAGQNKTPEVFISEFENIIRYSERGINAYCKANPDKAKAFRAALANFNGLKKEVTAWIATKPPQTEENTQTFENFVKKLKAASDEVDKYK